jgi:hypothetical protein
MVVTLSCMNCKLDEGVVYLTDPDLGAKQSGWLAILYDVGAIIGKQVHIP